MRWTLLFGLSMLSTSAFAGDSVDAGTVLAPQAKARELMVMGHFDADLIRRAAARSRKEIRGCHNATASRGDSSGFVEVKFVVSASGTVASTSVDQSTFKDPVLEGCLLAIVKSWVFPPIKAGGVAVVRYPFQLPL